MKKNRHRVHSPQFFSQEKELISLQRFFVPFLSSKGGTVLNQLYTQIGGL